MSKRILYLQYTDPALYPPLLQSSRILANRGWKILFLGVETPMAPGVSLQSHQQMSGRLMRCCPPGPQQKLHYAAFALWALMWALRWRPRRIYVSDPLGAPVGLMLSFLPGVRVVYHEHDSPLADTAAGAPSQWMTHLVLEARRRLAPRAVVRVLPNEARAEQFDTELGRSTASGTRTVCVWNCPSREEGATTPPARSNASLVLHYHGSLNRFRVPPAVLQAVALLRGRVKLQIVGYETIGHQGFAEEISRRAGELDIGEHVEIIPAVRRHQLLEIARRADVGLAVISGTADDPNLLALTGASNKVFDYMACGLALLVSDLPLWRRLYVDPGYALACDPDDPASIAAALRRFMDAADATRTMGERGRQRIITDWNYEAQFEPVLRVVENGLA